MDTKNNAISILTKYNTINKLNKVIVDEFIDKIYIGNVNLETKERDIIVEWNIEENI